MNDNPLQLRTKGGGIVSLYRKDDIDDWYEQLNTCKSRPTLVPKWRGFEVRAYKMKADANWKVC